MLIASLISRSIIQGSGLGPILWLVMASDLHPLSDVNIIVKYADDVNLLVTTHLHDEFTHIQRWADENAMVINLSKITAKTLLYCGKIKEMVCHRPHPSKFCLPPPLEGIEQVQTAKLLGVVFQGSFCFITHVDGILKLCSQRFFLLKQLRNQGMPLQQLHLIFQAIILNRITYAIAVWGPFVSADLWQNIRAFLKRSWRYGFCDAQALLDSAMHDLFVKIQNPDHCLHQLLLPERSTTNLLRERGHNFELYEYKFFTFHAVFCVKLSV